MNQPGPDEDSSVAYSTSTSNVPSGMVVPNSSCNPNGQNANKVPKISDTFNKTNNKPINKEEPDVIELSSKASTTSTNNLMYANSAKSINKSENQFSILTSSSAMNNNQISNETSATKVPTNILNVTNSTSSTKVPITAAASASSILSTTLLSATAKTSSSSVNVPINNETSNNSLFNNSNNINNNNMFNNTLFNENESHHMQSTPNRIINTFDKPLSTKSSSSERWAYNSKQLKTFQIIQIQNEYD